MGTAVLCFSQEGCMGCSEQAPINREMEKALRIRIEEVDVVKNPRFVAQYHLRVTPTILILENGEERKRFEGLVHREELEAALRDYL
ncbi:MAG TPA: thioredoxin family protein [Methanomicrobiales archaeon]|nr:thioredoxin family protein [Methanomicrobiales archaeon]